MREGENGGRVLADAGSTLQFPNVIPNWGSGDAGDMDPGLLEKGESMGLRGVVGMFQGVAIITPGNPAYCSSGPSLKAFANGLLSILSWVTCTL